MPFIVYKNEYFLRIFLQETLPLKSAKFSFELLVRTSQLLSFFYIKFTFPHSKSYFTKSERKDPLTFDAIFDISIRTAL